MAIQQLSAAKLKKMLDDLEQAGLDLHDFSISVVRKDYSDSPMDVTNEIKKTLSNNYMLDKDKQEITLYLNN